jgi:hypothetical protein
MKFRAAPDSDHKFCSECKITELVVRVAAEYLEICGEESLASVIIRKKKRRLMLVGHRWAGVIAT